MYTYDSDIQDNYMQNYQLSIQPFLWLFSIRFYCSVSSAFCMKLLLMIHIRLLQSLLHLLSFPLSNYARQGIFTALSSLLEASPIHLSLASLILSTIGRTLTFSLISSFPYDLSLTKVHLIHLQKIPKLTLTAFSGNMQLPTSF